jgi:VanZ family protein
MANSPAHASQTLFRYGLCFSFLFFFYGTLFPFHFDFSGREVSMAWSQAGLLPYWDVERGRITSVPDSVANILLTAPLGFLGLIHRLQKGKVSKPWHWFMLGIALGLTAEVLQLAVPSRSTSITDAINNGLGALVGAAAARLMGPRLLRFLEGTALDREHTRLWLLVGSLTVIMLGPFDFSLDVSQIVSDYRMLRTNPWELGVPIGDGWVQMAAFALVGAMSGRLAASGRFMRLSRLKAAVASVLLMPLAAEFSQVLLVSHAPSLRDLAMEVLGASAGFMVGTSVAVLARPITGFAVLGVALIAAGLSPGSFVGWPQRSAFKWIPFVEYYRKTTPGALYDAMMGLAGYGLLGGLLQAACRRRRHGLVAVLCMALAAGIEFAQVFLPTRFANLTDILIAGMGAWIGASICSGLDDGR